MRDWNTPPPSGAFPAPAEGLPPCLSFAAFDGRRVIMHVNCSAHTNPDSRYAHLAMGPLVRWDSGYRHQGKAVPYPLGTGDDRNAVSYADDPAEAATAFERGREYVRTGQLGETT